MILLQASHVTKSYGANIILDDVTLTVQSGERVGLVGANGAGKSTLAKILAGQLPCDAGDIIQPKNVTIGYLAQDSGLNSERSIYQELVSVFNHLAQMELNLRDLEKSISSKTTTNDEKLQQQLLSKYAHLSEKFKELGGYSYHAAIRSVMHGLNLEALGSDSPIKNLSGGQKTLVALAKLLLQAPDVLILDEPTNYLDINTLNWLEQYLKSYSGAILIISHDRYLLDSLVNTIYELESAKIYQYHGNYSAYLEQKAELMAAQLKQYNKQMDEIARMKDFIQRNIARAATSKRAQSRRRMLEKMNVIDKPRSTDKAHFSFNISRQSGKEVLKVENLAIGYGENTLAAEINFLIERGERVALMGPNGVGKSTLLKTIIGELKAKHGKIKFGANVEIGYYEQEQAKLYSTKQVLDELWDEYPHINEKDIRTVLGNFLFSGDDVLKSVQDLSGGEKARLALAKLMLKEANFLILDEPTNHLDIYSREVLENALIDFPGTILFVSHDRYFVNKIATRVIELSESQVTNYYGNYDYYVYKKEQLKNNTGTTPTRKEIKPKEQRDKQNYLAAKEAKRKERSKLRRLQQLENLIEQCEQRISELETHLTRPDVYQDHVKCLELTDELEQLKSKQEQYMEEWINLADQ